MGWDEVYKINGVEFLQVHPLIKDNNYIMINNQNKKLLDVGSGTGRHLLYFSKKKVDCYGFDISVEGIKISYRRLKQENLQASIINHDMFKKFPYEDEYFDYIISIQTINHGKIDDLKRIFDEIERVLKKGGRIIISVPKWRRIGETSRHYFKDGISWPIKIVEKNTYIPIEGLEKGIPHHVFSQKEIKSLLKKFEIHKIQLDKWNKYCVFAEKL